MTKTRQILSLKRVYLQVMLTATCPTVQDVEVEQQQFSMPTWVFPQDLNLNSNNLKFSYAIQTTLAYQHLDDLGQQDPSCLALAVISYTQILMFMGGFAVTCVVYNFIFSSPPCSICLGRGSIWKGGHYSSQCRSLQSKSQKRGLCFA